MAALKTAKRELRQRIKQVLSDVPADSTASQTANALRVLFAMQEYQAAKRISVYLSMPSGEISTADIVRDALQKGKKVFVPYTYKLSNLPSDGPTSVMDMVALRSFSDFESFKPDKWGIPMPPEDSVKDRENCLGVKGLSDGAAIGMKSGAGLDLIVMPGMAFDVDMRRLGHGKGFYDSFLSRYHSSIIHSVKADMPLLVGLCLREQLLPPDQSIPTEQSDWRLDSLVTGDGRLLQRTGV